jgi:hypothetical protein
MTDKTAAAGWQPIDTAPEDGTPQVVNDPEYPGTWSRAYWDYIGWIDEQTGLRMHPQPTHWLPVPALTDVTS